MVTSPPYYNAREYSQWNNLNDYLNEMKEIIKECYRVIDNTRIFDNDSHSQIHERSSARGLFYQHI